MTLYTIVLKEEKSPARKVVYHRGIALAFDRQEANKFYEANFANDGHKVVRVSTWGVIDYFLLDPIKRKLYK